MAIVDVIEAKDIDQLQQVLLGALGRLEEIVEKLRDETTVRITIEFQHTPKP